MSSTNKTTHYELSQYVGSDKPTYLSDYNGDMLKIDTGINAAKTTADTANTAATTAQTTAETAQTTANTAITNAATAQSGVNTNSNNIGNLTNLTTASKSNLVSAINELDGEIGNLSQLTTDSKTDLVNAINSVETKIEELDNYSTNEADTGKKWVNNKTIYRKVIVANNSLNESEFVIDTPSIIEEMVDIHVVGYNNVEERPLPNVIISYASGNTYTGVTYRDNNSEYRPNQIEIIDASPYSQFKVIIEYTKRSI